jgi:glycosyltransferase involved in cell wall biosynthesis
MATGIILSTPAALEKVGHIARNSKKIRVIPYGIDAEIFNEGPFPPDPTILFLGHVMHHKGILVLLEAYRHVLQRLPGVKLVVAGTGSEMEVARALAASIAASDQISFVGRVRREDIPRVMQNCTLYCMPSYGEAFGLGALEAMACGRPVVGTDAGGLAHLISDEGGRKVGMGDAPALAEAMLEILSDPLLAQRMGAANRRLVEQRYAWPRVIDQLEEMYFTILRSTENAARAVIPH